MICILEERESVCPIVRIERREALNYWVEAGNRSRVFRLPGNRSYFSAISSLLYIFSYVPYFNLIASVDQQIKFWRLFN